MKTDDIFEALTDIDDKFIAAAHPSEFGEEQPELFRPEPREPVWKTLVPIAACLAVVGVAGAFGLRYFNTRPNVENSNISASGDLTSETSVEDYRVGVSYMKEITINDADGQKYFAMDEFPGYRFGAFSTGIVMFGLELETDTTMLIEGEVQNLYLCDLNGDGKRELCTTVEKDGVRSVEVVDLANGSLYTSNKDWYKSSYLMSIDNSDADILMMNSVLKGDGVETAAGGALTLDRLVRIFPNTSDVIHPGEDDNKFVLAEFPNLYFILQDGAVYMRDISSPDAMYKKIMDAWYIDLVDLNGDGKRELFTSNGVEVSFDESFVKVYDIENDDIYYRNRISITEYKGVLCTMEYNAQTDTTDTVPLTLDVLEKQAKPDYEEVPLAFDYTFSQPDFEGFTFSVNTSAAPLTFYISWENGGVVNEADCAYLCDLDGDGRREIVLRTPDAGIRSVKVYGYTDDGRMGSVEYYVDGGYWLVESGGKLLCETQDGEMRPLEFSKSDLEPILRQSYYVEDISQDHTVDFKDILSWSSKYDISVEDRRLIVKLDLSHTFTSDEMTELYCIPDVENNRLILAYTSVDGKVFAEELTANSRIDYVFDDGFSLKPTDDELMAIDRRGKEKPFKNSISR